MLQHPRHFFARDPIPVAASPLIWRALERQSDNRSAYRRRNAPGCPWQRAWSGRAQSHRMCVRAATTRQLHCGSAPSTHPDRHGAAGSVWSNPPHRRHFTNTEAKTATLAEDAMRRVGHGSGHGWPRPRGRTGMCVRAAMTYPVHRGSVRRQPTQRRCDRITPPCGALCRYGRGRRTQYRRQSLSPMPRGPLSSGVSEPPAGHPPRPPARHPPC